MAVLLPDTFISNIGVISPLALFFSGLHINSFGICIDRISIKLLNRVLAIKMATIINKEIQEKNVRN